MSICIREGESERSCDLGQTERGIEDFNEAIRLEPGYEDAYYYRGLAYKEQGRKAEAIADVKFGAPFLGVNQL